MFEALWVQFWSESIFLQFLTHSRSRCMDNRFSKFQFIRLLYYLSQLCDVSTNLKKCWGGATKHIATHYHSTSINRFLSSVNLLFFHLIDLSTCRMVADSVTCLHWEINIMYLYVHQEYIAEIRLRYWIVTVVLAVTTSTIPSYIPAILDLSLEEKTQSHVSQILIGLHLLNVKVSADYIILLSIRISLWQTLEVMFQQYIPECTRVNKNIPICIYYVCILCGLPVYYSAD